MLAQQVGGMEFAPFTEVKQNFASLNQAGLDWCYWDRLSMVLLVLGELGAQSRVLGVSTGTGEIVSHLILLGGTV